MSNRVRLTAKSVSAADQTPYPGNVNQPDRKDPKWDEYHTFEQKVNHELPDMRHDWQNDERDDIGFGVPEAWGKQPTVASVRVAANKAVRVATLLLGDKVADTVIEAQATDFMAMSPKAMDRTLQRFADTQALYKAADEADEKPADEKKEEKAEEKKAADEKLPDFIKEKIEEKKEDKKEDKPAEEKKAGEAEFLPKIEKPGAEVKAADEKPADDKAEEKVEEKVEEKKASTTGKVAGEFDIELTSSTDDELEDDPEADERLASLFDDPSMVATQETSSRKTEASQKKTGITKLGGQPRVASAEGNGVELSSLWKTAPDVNEAFR